MVSAGFLSPSETAGFSKRHTEVRSPIPIERINEIWASHCSLCLRKSSPTIMPYPGVTFYRLGLVSPEAAPAHRHLFMILAELCSPPCIRTFVIPPTFCERLEVWPPECHSPNEAGKLKEGGSPHFSGPTSPETYLFHKDDEGGVVPLLGKQLAVGGEDVQPTRGFARALLRFGHIFLPQPVCAIVRDNPPIPGEHGQFGWGSGE